MKRLFKSYTLALMGVFFVAGCNEPTPPSAKGEDNGQVIEKIEFKMFSPSEEDLALINERMEVHLRNQSEGDFSAGVENYFPKIFRDEAEKLAIAKAMQDNRAAGNVQTFTGSEMLWASPFFKENGYEVCLAMFRLEHTIELTGEMASKFDTYDVFVRDVYGKDYYTEDPENKRFIVDGPVKFFFFKTDEGKMYLLNEEILRSAIAAQLFQPHNLQDMKAFETKAREVLGY